MFTDAPSSICYGAILGTYWFNGSCSNQFIDYQITHKKIFPFVLALEIWGVKLKNKCFLLHSGNNTVVHFIDKQTCKDKHIIYLVRRLVLDCMKFNILIRSQHVPRRLIDLADMLSRLQITQFRKKPTGWTQTKP